MIELGTLAPFLVMGVAGAPHCAGMCGGFALLVGGQGTGPALLARQSTYALGKAIAYGILGLLAFAAGSQVLGESGLPLSTAHLMACLAAAVLILAGLARLGVRLPVPRAWSHGSSGLRAALRRVLAGADALPAHTRPLAIGLLNGLVPCGLSWAAIAMSAVAPNPLVAFLGPLVFGIATFPALLTVAVGSRWIPDAWGTRVAAIAMLVFGALMMARSFPRISAAEGEGPSGAACCETPGSDGAASLP